MKEESKSQRQWIVQGNFLLDTAGHCTYELTAAVTACIRSAQTQARHNFRMEKGGKQETTPPVKKLLAVDSC